MNTFIGNIEARLDGKGRVFVPASYRKILAEMGSTHIVMRRDTDNECVIFYPEHVWHQKVSQLRNALFTYTFEEIPTYTVTYKVVSGTWADGTTADKTETVADDSEKKPYDPER